MPSKHRIRQYGEDCYYHIYNRGVEKRDIFLDIADYNLFIYTLRKYLEPDFKIIRKNPTTNERIVMEPDHVYKDISLLAFCLMPNHFHLLVKLKKRDGATKLMRRVCTNYVGYFNEKYERVGALFQGTFKAVRVTTQEQCLQLSRYIHINPRAVTYKGNIESYVYSSFYYLCRDSTPSWLDFNSVLLGNTVQDYKKFVMSRVEEDFSEAEKSTLSNVLLD
ncbi:hypothetical protein AUJ94_02895 [bacterium CG2_30_40_12]|uniref:Transposase IS200-like domain-containing protein n=1 Tax=candidate division WWE3 bacterium CG23_combo_of_CG06-09_8_20_14_all_40_14 TaxID=1975095 RepID=A0A2G9XCF7_UNCKA|nr:MAG: hypothetical protein AUJ94_02895 [bacterium CG2_30_40_12]PIP04665.1 MAG: hypothetical protein COX53_01485 [candidate division WWE3 bacterium CG23_combo_of_CG06-09_8_20_14_all_40_14]PJE50903.1 MAG: hypothetical protein COV27_02335 [candidate division WWE3 bacterium CG10_big_fil_rev_8_21_14_0_10_39_14]